MRDWANWLGATGLLFSVVATVSVIFTPTASCFQATSLRGVALTILILSATLHIFLVDGKESP